VSVIYDGRRCIPRAKEGEKKTKGRESLAKSPKKGSPEKGFRGKKKKG